MTTMLVHRPPFCLAIAVVVTMTHCTGLLSQVQGKQESDLGGHTVPSLIEPKPFTMGLTSEAENGNRPHVAPVQFLQAVQMTTRDKVLEADMESSIAEHAARLGYALSVGNWTYQQVVCPAFPGHLFLQFTRREGVGDVTEFSAAIPRQGQRQVRIIPILKRSYSLFAPAPVNAITIAAFNHIRAEETDQANADWLGNALCYAALAGAQPELPARDTGVGSESAVPRLTAQLVVPLHGGEEIQLDDDADLAHPLQWTLFFNRKGGLVKATRRRGDRMPVKAVPERSAVSKTWTVPAN